MKTKIKSPRQLAKICAKLRMRGQAVVFTNGCFDLLHVGHVRYLSAAKKLGDILIVALNSNASVKRIKGTLRPINPLSERAEIIAALGCVDYVTWFHESDPTRLIVSLKPDVLVKGGDWKPREIIGSDVVLKAGGIVRSLPYHSGKSTTRIIEKIRDRE